MVTILYIDFLDNQGGLTLKSMMGSGRNSHSSKLLWMSLLPARIKKIHTKMKPLEWSQHSPIISFGDFFQMLKDS